MNKKDWLALGYDGGTWHHRQLLVETLKKHLPFKTLLDVGCAHGPDLAIINADMPDVECSGFDITKGDIEDGQERLPNSKLWVADIREELPKIPDNSYDVVLSNGVMMYCERPLMKELLRIARKSVVLSERDTGGHMINYLQGELGTDPTITKITQDIRDSWKEDGFIYEIKVDNV